MAVEAALELTAELMSELGTSQALLALMGDPSTMSDVIRVYDRLADDMRAYDRALPSPPPEVAAVDRHFRNALQAYEESFSGISDGFRLIDSGNLEAADALLTSSITAMDRGTSSIEAATDALPSSGC